MVGLLLQIHTLHDVLTRFLPFFCLLVLRYFNSHIFKKSLQLYIRDWEAQLRTDQLWVLFVEMLKFRKKVWTSSLPEWRVNQLKLTYRIHLRIELIVLLTINSTINSMHLRRLQDISFIVSTLHTYMVRASAYYVHVRQSSQGFSHFLHGQSSQG